MDNGSRTRLLSAVVIAAVFGAGILVGFAADSSLSAEGTDAIEVTEVVSEEPTAEVEEERPRGTRISRMLDPTPAQLDRIDAIVAVHRDRTNALDEEVQAEFRRRFRQEILLETRAEIKAVFGPEKAAEYQRLLDEHDARQAAERENPDDG